MRDNILHCDHLAFSVRVVVLVLTMTSNLHSDSLSIFKDGKLKPGTYKIQNIYTETFLDIEIHSRGMCCRPARDLGEGRGLVRLYLLSVVHVSDGGKWEIKPLGAGYSVQVVSMPTLFGAISPLAC